MENRSLVTIAEHSLGKIPLYAGDEKSLKPIPIGIYWTGK